MKLRQWEIWKCNPPGFERDHWFIIISAQERLDHPHRLLVNGLACYKLQGEPKKLDIRLNGADGFDSLSVRFHVHPREIKIAFLSGSGFVGTSASDQGKTQRGASILNAHAHSIKILRFAFH